MRFSSSSLRLLAAGTSLLILGILFGNMVLIYLGSMPVVFIVLVLVVGEIEVVKMTPSSDGREVVVGDELEFVRDVTIRGGMGIVAVHEELPEHFRLVSGNNMRLSFKGLSDLHLRISYRVECTRRGIYRFKGPEYQFWHILGLLDPKRGSLPNDQVVVVKPEPASIRKVRERRQAALLPAPAETYMRMGIDTTEFREMRRYGFGDPYRKINWKATSRALTASGLLPIVNEYEREGRRVVYIFLNCGKSMAAGSSLENGFEYGVQVALGLTQYYIDRQGVVGFSLFNEDTPIISKDRLSSSLRSLYQLKGPSVMADLILNNEDIEHREIGEANEVQIGARRFSVFPDSGRRQLLKIRMLLQDAGVDTATYNLSQSFHLSLGNLRSARPLLIFITSVRPDSSVKMREDLIKILRMLGRRSTNGNRLMVLNISCFGLSARSREDELAVRVAKIQEERLLAETFSDLASVVNWDPRENSLIDALSSQVKSV